MRTLCNLLWVASMSLRKVMRSQSQPGWCVSNLENGRNTEKTACKFCHRRDFQWEISCHGNHISTSTGIWVLIFGQFVPWTQTIISLFLTKNRPVVGSTSISRVRLTATFCHLKPSLTHYYNYFAMPIVFLHRVLTLRSLLPGVRDQ